MKAFPRLNLPSCKFKVRRSKSDCIHVWDIVRNMWLVLTPEEWVRQHIIDWLINEVKVPRTSIVCEYAVNVNGLSQRADIVAFVDAIPTIIVECKAPDIPINKSVFAQISRYNSVVDARFIILSNGLETLYFDSKDGDYKQINSIEILEKMNRL